MAKSKKGKRGASGTVRRHRTKGSCSKDNHSVYRFAMRMIGAKCAKDQEYRSESAILQAALGGRFGMLVRRAAYTVPGEKALNLIAYGKRFNEKRKCWY